MKLRTISTYAASAGIATVCSEGTLVLLYGVLGVSPGIASVVAWFAGAVPNFFLNRAWTWQRRGRPSLRGELLPYVAIVLATLLVAIVATHVVDHLLADADNTVRTTLVAVTYFGVYVLMFFVRFFLFRWLYTGRRPAGATL